MRRCLEGSNISTHRFRNIEPFGDQHKSLRAAFSSGSEPLDRYLKQQATQDIARRAAAVYVLASEDGARIAGFYTLSADNIDASDLPDGLVKQLNLPRYPYIAATLLGRLARDLAYKGQGIGELLLVDALQRALQISRDIASAAVIVDAKDDNAHRFYSSFGFLRFPDSHMRLFLPMATIEQLFQKR